MSDTIVLTVNGTRHETRAAPDTPLLYVLRNDLELNGPKLGCGLGQCGACTVRVGGDAVRSCTLPVSAVKDRPVQTVEGLGTVDAPHPLQRAFIAEQAGQCGYCLSGMIMAAAALLAATPHPSDEQIRSALAGNLCRCGSHLRILRAVRAAAPERPRGRKAPKST